MPLKLFFKGVKLEPALPVDESFDKRHALKARQDKRGVDRPSSGAEVD